MPQTYTMVSVFGRVYLKVLDYCLQILTTTKKTKRPPESPKKILICNGAHLGDVVMATTIAYWLKETFPNIKIGLLTGSWSKIVGQDHPCIDVVYWLDHPKLNRSNDFFIIKLIQYFKTLLTSLYEINRCQYDCMIDTYFYYPNMSLFLSLTNGRYRIGNGSGGAGRLFHCNVSASVPFDRPMLDYMSLSLHKLGYISRSFPYKNILIQKKNQRVISDDYICIHPASESHLRLWRTEYWMTVISELIQRGYHIVITGKGKMDLCIQKQLASHQPNITSLVNKLTWGEFVSTVHNAKLVISVETVCCHIAGLNNQPLVALYSDHSNHVFWQPAGQNTHILKPISKITPDIVISNVLKYLK
jgi:ADP-heptose:LPS heptosyltransferase